jgi:hypothetical protein
VAALPPNAKHAPLATPAAPALTPGEEAVRELLAPLDWGEAPQIGILGDTGWGKTTLMVALVGEYLRRSPGWALVIDDKELSARYAGQERRDLEDLRDHPIDPNGPRVIVFRGDPRAGVDADPEQVAELAWKRSARGRASLIVHDELLAGRDYLVKSRQWRTGIVYVPKSFTKGRQVGVGDLWGAQSPSEVPIDPFEQSNGIACGKLDGLGLAKLKERNYLRGDVEQVIPRLHGMEVAPALRGDFVVLRRGQPWNRKVYKLQGVS